ncbi:hypothetical protein M407DRAFT_243513 [Tulasnella calospora MUT 4182]|uniref:Uncharacterized protein n=1 Tax=Tulasnella calospora MUT 4182 TaxID=1051891 RepID=A0A0C3M0A1_9AGAM|nr:hypothetical protein M407DRAFT_247075 [Tulasnella calospora MUT 4182]KIO27067.1 hypothetical protein M407DRAFT_243513 [Tulasnella calospora MUT 4182]
MWICYVRIRWEICGASHGQPGPQIRKYCFLRVNLPHLVSNPPHFTYLLLPRLATSPYNDLPHRIL